VEVQVRKGHRPKINVVYEGWSASLAQRARNLVVWQAEQRAADELDRQLRARATIMVNNETLKQVRGVEEGAGRLSRGLALGAIGGRPCGQGAGLAVAGWRWSRWRLPW
jgi:Phloem filament protein PP1 cystatin-like domain